MVIIKSDFYNVIACCSSLICTWYDRHIRGIKTYKSYFTLYTGVEVFTGYGRFIYCEFVNYKCKFNIILAAIYPLVVCKIGNVYNNAVTSFISIGLNVSANAHCLGIKVYRCVSLAIAIISEYCCVCAWLYKLCLCNRPLYLAVVTTCPLMVAIKNKYCFVVTGCGACVTAYVLDIGGKCAEINCMNFCLFTNNLISIRSNYIGFIYCEFVNYKCKFNVILAAIYPLIVCKIGNVYNNAVTSFISIGLNVSANAHCLGIKVYRCVSLAIAIISEYCCVCAWLYKLCLCNRPWNFTIGALGPFMVIIKSKFCYIRACNRSCVAAYILDVRRKCTKVDCVNFCLFTNNLISIRSNYTRLIYRELIDNYFNGLRVTVVIICVFYCISYYIGIYIYKVSLGFILGYRTEVCSCGWKS